ncbi:MAG: hypothetical protein QOH31_2734 [Verrucomicrobiota bacterium]
MQLVCKPEVFLLLQRLLPRCRASALESVFGSRRFSGRRLFYFLFAKNLLRDLLVRVAMFRC